MAILQTVTANNGQKQVVNVDQLTALLAKLQAENEALKAKNTAIRFKVGEKGGVSVFGLNSRFPVTLYANQWERLLAQAEQLKAFIAANEGSLSRK